MKNLIVICTVLITLSYGAQSPILPLYNNPNAWEVDNAYYKDIDNVQDQYVGTWLYTNGNTSLEIQLRKRTMVFVNGTLANYYVDVLVGEYKYIENGVEKVNTLEYITAEFMDNTDYNLYSNSLRHKNTYPQCNECATSEKRLVITINEPLRRHIGGLSNKLVMRRFFVNGIEKLKLWFKRNDNGIYYNISTVELIEDESINGYSLPYGEYILVKQ
ncbi:DUF6705 family protein [Psychroserpens sp. MEBiC05023]